MTEHYGQQDDGFIPKPLRVMREQVFARLRNRISDSLNLDSVDSVAGNYTDAILIELDQIWQVAQKAYDSLNRDTAVGFALDTLALILGIERKGEEFTRGEILLFGDLGTVVPEETTFEVRDANTRYITTERVELTDSQASSSGKGDAVASIRSVEVGPFEGVDGDILDKVDSVGGLNGDTARTGDDRVAEFNGNVDKGRLVESNTALRQRIEVELAESGGGSDLAILTDISALEGVDFVRVINNRTDKPNIRFALPPNSYKVLINPDPRSGAGQNIDEEEVVRQTANNGPAGIDSIGEYSATRFDENGDPDEINYGAFQERDIYVDVEVTTNDEYPDNGNELVEQRILDTADTLVPGANIILLTFEVSIAKVSGVTDIFLQMGFDPSPSNTQNITSLRKDEIAIFDESRINVTEV